MLFTVHIGYRRLKIHRRHGSTIPVHKEVSDIYPSRYLGVGLIWADSNLFPHFN
jgi:hypothetical protein